MQQLKIILLHSAEIKPQTHLTDVPGLVFGKLTDACAYECILCALGIVWMSDFRIHVRPQPPV
jgi:hypothetical protein